MTPSEKQEVVILLEKQEKIKISCFDYMRHVLDMPEENLASVGYKTKQEALEVILRDSMKKLKRLHDEHIKKYPD